MTSQVWKPQHEVGLEAETNVSGVRLVVKSLGHYYSDPYFFKQRWPALVKQQYWMLNLHKIEQLLKEITIYHKPVKLANQLDIRIYSAKEKILYSMAAILDASDTIFNNMSITILCWLVLWKVKSAMKFYQWHGTCNW